MLVITYELLRLGLSSWCLEREAGFKKLWPLKGGWELWAQADFAAYLIQQESSIDVLREQYIYNSWKKVDWLFNFSTEDPATMIAIELKCQSLENEANLINGLTADIDKLAKLNIRPQFADIQRVVVGICFDPDAATWMTGNGFTAAYDSTEVFCGTCLLA